MGSIRHYQHSPFLVVLVLAFAGLSACASAPPAVQPSTAVHETPSPAPDHRRSRAQRGLAFAREMLGAPYRYGAAGPNSFDCSGLVYYSYRKAGIAVPRTTGAQYRRSRRVALSRLQPGDLLFFRISRKKPSHVGIYAGGGRFIHAPSGGKPVSYASLDDPYWESRVIGAGRLQ
jgi:cell wall-associated NlpC family hydrolase